MVRRLNEANDNINARHLQEVFNDECVQLYQGLMKSLGIVKILKQEIHNFNTMHLHD
jgi:hypothetical protein